MFDEKAARTALGAPSSPRFHIMPKEKALRLEALERAIPQFVQPVLRHLLALTAGAPEGEHSEVFAMSIEMLMDLLERPEAWLVERQRQMLALLEGFKHVNCPARGVFHPHPDPATAVMQCRCGRDMSYDVFMLYVNATCERDAAAQSQEEARG